MYGIECGAYRDTSDEAPARQVCVVMRYLNSRDSYQFERREGVLAYVTHVGEICELLIGRRDVARTIEEL